MIAHRGSNAGWELARAASEISLREVRDALDDGPLFGLHATTPSDRCPIGYRILPTIEEVYQQAERAADEQLSKISIAATLDATLATSNSSRPELLDTFAASIGRSHTSR